MNDLDEDVALPFPLEFIIKATPRSHQSSNGKAKEAWKATVGGAAKDRIAQGRELTFLDDRPLSATIYYFSPAPMQGDVDNIVKLILDGMLFVVYPNDQVIERVVVQKFEPDVFVEFQAFTEVLQEAAAADPPVVYVRVDDDISWRQVP